MGEQLEIFANGMSCKCCQRNVMNFAECDYIMLATLAKTLIFQKCLLRYVGMNIMVFVI